MMTASEFGRCVHPRELPRFLLALLFALPMTLALFALSFLSSGLALALLLLLAFIAWFGFEIVYASLLGNWILVSEHNYPKLNDLLAEMKERIGVSNKIDIIVYDQSQFTAYLRLLFARRAIYIGSELLAQGVTDDELRWLIGRYVGYIRSKRRMGPLRYVIALAERLLVFNLFIYPYERATAYSGDRVGLAAINGDISSAVSTMNKLMVGRELGYSVNPAGIVRQHRRVKGSLFGFLARLLWPLPHMTARYVDLIAHAERTYPDPYEQFAAMNPSFQVSGGTWPLLRATEKTGDGYSNALGWLLLLGMLAAASGSGLLLSRGGLGGYFYERYFPGMATTAPEEYGVTEDMPAAPAEAIEPYTLDQLHGDVAAAAEQARQAKALAENAATEAATAALYAEQGYSGFEINDGDDDFAGDRYSGAANEGAFHGPGIYAWAVNANSPDSANGQSRYEGQWVNFTMAGYGVGTWRNSNEYYGQWNDSQMVGYGVFVWTDGRRYEGQWARGTFNGNGVMWDAYGNVTFSGVWVDGVETTELWR